MNLSAFENNLLRTNDLTSIEKQFFNFNNQLVKANKNNIKKSPGTAGKIKGEWNYQSRFGNLNYRGIREKVMKLNNNVLRRVAGQVAPIMAIHQYVTSNLRPFRNFTDDPDTQGFMIKLKDRDKVPNKQEKQEIKEIEEFFTYTGQMDLPLTKGEYPREDMLGDVNERLTRDLLTIDQVAIVPRFNVEGRLIEFRILDGATIKRIEPEQGFDGDKSIHYVQMIKGDVVEVFEHNEIIFDYMNKRTDIDKWVYGYSPLEMMIDTITAFLYATAYNKEIFNTATQPKGFISLKGDNFDEEELEEVRKRFNSMFSGIKGLWRIPFFQGDADFKPMFMNNREMEFDKYMQLLLSWICAIYKIDPAELGWKLQYQGNVSFENTHKKQSFSKSRIINDVVGFLENVYNKILRLDPVWKDKYKIVATGLKPRDEKYEADINKLKVETYMTVNELRKEYDLKSLPDGDILLNNVYQQAKQMTEMENQGMDEGNFEEEIPGEENPFDVDSMTDEVFDDIFKSKKMSLFDLIK